MGKDLKQILSTLLKFRDERDWAQFHTAKNLAISISIEAGELLEHFQWLRQEEKLSPAKKVEAARELADIFIYLLLLSRELDVDIIDAAKKKIEENDRKYPVEKARGTAKKYKEL